MTHISLLAPPLAGRRGASHGPSKRLILVILAAAAISAGCTAPLVPARSDSPAAVQTEARTITVTGDAEVRVVPDEVVLTLGVETRDTEIDAAKRQNDEVIKAAIDVAKQYGVRQELIKTEYLGVEPRYRDSYEKRDFLGYYARRTLVITVRDLSKFEELLAAELKAGVNYVHAVDFRTTELRKHKDTARSMAIKAAQEKATDMAAELQLRLGEPRSILENQSSSWSWYNSWWGAGWASSVAQNVSQNAAGSAGGESLEGATAPGQISVRAKVTVSFDLSR